MSKAQWEWWRKGITWTAAQRLGLLALANKSEDGTLPPDGSPIRFCNCFGVKAIGEAAGVDNPSRFCKVMKPYLALTLIPAGDGQKRDVWATRTSTAQYCGRIYRCACRITHRGRPRRPMQLILSELVEAIEKLPATKRGNLKAEQDVIKRITAKYVSR